MKKIDKHINEKPSNIISYIYDNKKEIFFKESIEMQLFSFQVGREKSNEKKQAWVF